MRNVQIREKVFKNVEEGKAIKIVFWNVHALGGMKADGWIYLEEFDVIGLTGTFYTKKKENEVRSELKDYKSVHVRGVTHKR